MIRGITGAVVTNWSGCNLKISEVRLAWRSRRLPVILLGHSCFLPKKETAVTGEVTEWPIVLDSKSSVGVSSPGVQIPPSPLV